MESLCVKKKSNVATNLNSEFEHSILNNEMFDYAQIYKQTKYRSGTQMFGTHFEIMNQICIMDLN